MKRIEGLSLIEVLTALAIAAVLLTMALPACLAVIDRARIARVQADLGDAFLSGARLAVASGTATVLCPARETGGCTGGIDWSQGWLLFADVDGDRRYGGHDTLIRRTAALPGRLRLSSSQGRPKIVFQADGDNAGSNATFSLCAPRNGQAGSLSLSNSGHFRLAKATAAQLHACSSD